MRSRPGLPLRLGRAGRGPAAALGLGVLALLGAACGTSGSGAKSGQVSLPAGSVAGGGASRGTASRFVVGQRVVTFVDRSRPTPAVDGRPRLPQRTLKVELLYPALSAKAGPDLPVVSGAQPVPRTSPLLVFVPGIGSAPDSYRSHLLSWAAAGYVVAGVWLPVASGPGGTGDDYRNEPEDVGFVISSMLAAGDPVRSAVDPTEVAVAGHSIGAQTVLAHVYNTCCGDRRVGAVVAISGSEIPYGGSWGAPPATPLLLVHGGQDHTVGFASSQTILDSFPGPRALLAFPAASHTSHLVGRSGQLLDAAVVAFLDHALRHDDAAWNALPSKVAASGIATLTTRG